MNNLVNLMSMVGSDKTLIIACGEYGFSKHIELNDRIFILTLSESMLQNHDPLEKGRIQHFIDSRECTQVIIVGSLEQHLLERLLHDESIQSPIASMKFNLKIFLKNQNKQFLRETVRDQMLLELHIIKQCNLLMDYYFIRDRVENDRLQVRGFVTDFSDEHLKPIFCNGIIYNGIISMN